MIDHISKILAAGLLLPLTLLSSGCGSDTTISGAVNVSGIIYLDGQPLPEADIRFIGKELTLAGKTNSEGRYTLVQGALPGEYMVSISKWKGGKFDIDPEAGMDEGQFLAMQDPAMLGVAQKSNLGPEQMIPARFSSATKSEIVFQVPEAGTESADFRLTGK